jgi:MtrB/PioB family decaheme-associated outer membrane protein
MTNAKPQLDFSRTIIALSLFAAFGSSYAAEPEDVSQYIKPESSATVGLGLTSGDQRDRSIFGQYNGMRKDSGYLLFDFDVSRRDDATGLWTNATGRNLGLDNRELRFSQQKQGDWKYGIEYNEIVRHDPRTINTGLQGAGTTTPNVVRLAAPGTGSDIDLELKRKNLSLGIEKRFSPELSFEASFKNEDKDGARIFGRGYQCASYVCTNTLSATNVVTALLMLPEPVNSTTKQFEAKLNYAGEKLRISGGYYGSFYNNANGSMTATVPGVLNNAFGGTGTLAPAATGGTSLQNVLQMPTALPPDNQAHQFYVSGNYAFTKTTRATFKYAYTHATQNEDFLGSGLTGAPAGRSDLGGRIDTTLLQAGLTAKPMPKLSLLANVRFEDKKDKTPLAYYNIEGLPAAATSRNQPVWTNGNLPNKKLAGKVEATYQLPQNYRATLGVDYESIDRGTFTPTDNVAGLSGLRQKTDETGYRAELRRALTETFSGSIGYVHSRREGSSWLQLYSINNGVGTNTSTLPNTGVNPVSDAAIYSRTGIFPMMLMNRTREKVKMSADWSPIEQLSLQFILEDGKDKYSAPTQKGMQDSGVRLYSVDAALTLSEKLKLTAYASQGEQTLHVAQGNLGYIADLKNTTTTIGLGIVGKPSSKLEIGGDLTYGNDINRYGLGVDAGTQPLSAANLVTQANNTAQAAIGLPDVTNRMTTLKLYGKYALAKSSDVRVELIHQRVNFSEWSWGYNGVPFTYSDNTTIGMNQLQNTTFVGATYTYKWQ